MYIRDSVYVPELRQKVKRWEREREREGEREVKREREIVTSKLAHPELFRSCPRF